MLYSNLTVLHKTPDRLWIFIICYKLQLNIIIDIQLYLKPKSGAYKNSHNNITFKAFAIYIVIFFHITVPRNDKKL